MHHSGGWIPKRVDISLAGLFIAWSLNVIGVWIAYKLYSVTLDGMRVESVLLDLHYASEFGLVTLIYSLIVFLRLYSLTKTLRPGRALRVFLTVGGLLMFVSGTFFATSVIRLSPLLDLDIPRLAAYMSISTLQAGVGLAILLIGKNRFRNSINNPLHRQHGPTPGGGNGSRNLS